MDDIYFLMEYKGSRIFIMREDLIPFSFGGNKVRIVKKAFEDMQKKGCNAFLSYGSRSSNLNRVSAHMAKMHDIPCTVIFKTEDTEDGSQKSYNERLVCASGARTVYCGPKRVRETVEAELERFREHGLEPYYIYGDPSGHGHEAMLMEAYTEAYQEIRAYETESGISFSRIFLASGTGITQSGLIAGALMDKAVKKPQITGISVARSKEQGRAVIAENIRLYLEAKGFCVSDIPPVEFRDDYVLGGYGAENSDIKRLCRDMMNSFGLPLDETYTGKAFYGMLKEIETRGLVSDILFIHTGGLPLVFDGLGF